MQPAIFLDRDGVLNEDRPDYVKTWAEFQWLEGALAGIAALSRLGVPLFIVTNQSMVGRGLVARCGLEEIHRQMLADIKRSGGRVDGVLVCAHSPEDGCACRKPKPGLLVDVARARGLDLSRSVFVGDALTDFLAARSAGVPYIHVRSGRGTHFIASVRDLDPSVTVMSDLSAAVPVCMAMIGGPHHA